MGCATRGSDTRETQGNCDQPIQSTAAGYAYRGAGHPPRGLRARLPCATTRDMRDRFDALSKDALETLLRDVGTVERGADAGATSQRVDVLFTPDAEHRLERQSRGLLGRLVDERPCDLEPFRNTPTVAILRGCVRRSWTLHHVRELAVQREHPESSLPMWRVVVLSPGRPQRALKVFGLKRPKGFPRGVYASDDEIGLWVVVLSELPETRDTLSLRVLARGDTQKRAVAELLRLSKDAWEHRLFAVLVQWRHEITLEGVRSDDDEDFMQTTRFSLEAYEQQLRDEGISQGISQGSLKVTARQIERRLGRTLTTAECDYLSTRIATEGPERVGDLVLDLSPEALAAWVSGVPAP